jgi:hypothetical protein
VRAKSANEAFAQRAKKLPAVEWQLQHDISAVENALIWSKDDPAVGGPVDVAVFEPKTGVRWIRRKENCYKQDGWNE